MKTLPQLIQLLFAAACWDKKLARKRSASEASVIPPAEAAPQPGRVSFADDDSPPGYKIRWH